MPVQNPNQFLRRSNLQPQTQSYLKRVQIWKIVCKVFSFIICACIAFKQSFQLLLTFVDNMSIEQLTLKPLVKIELPSMLVCDDRVFNENNAELFDKYEEDTVSQ